MEPESSLWYNSQEVWTYIIKYSVRVDAIWYAIFCSYWDYVSSSPHCIELRRNSLC
jgi:hypothetical protein